MALRYNQRDQRRLDNREIFTDTMLSNPLTVSAAGINLIAGGCISLTGAFVLSLIMTALLPMIGYLSAVEDSSRDHTRRMTLYCAASVFVTLLISLALDLILPYGIAEVGIFAPMAAFDSYVLARTAQDAPIMTKREAASYGLACALMFALIAFPVAFIREVVGSGAFFGLYLGFSGIGSLRMPFAGFILCGIAIAVYRVISGRIAGKGDAQ